MLQNNIFKRKRETEISTQIRQIWLEEIKYVWWFNKHYYNLFVQISISSTTVLMFFCWLKMRTRRKATNWTKNRGSQASIKFQCIRFPSEEFFYSNKKEHIFCCLLLVLDWFLIEIVKYCVNAQTKHIQFWYNVLIFESHFWVCSFKGP